VTGRFDGALAVMRVAGYRNYTIGSAVSLIGTSLQQVAQGWLVWELTDSPAWLGLISFSTLGSLMLAAPLAGGVADRVDRLRLAQIAQVLLMLQAVALAALVWTGHADRWIVLGLAIYLGVCQSFHTASRLALVPNLVPPELLPPAIAINSVIYQVGRFVGPALGGIVIVTLGTAWAFALNALSFVAFLSVLMRLDVAFRDPPAPRAPLGESIAEGFRYAANHRGIAPMLLMLIVSTFTVRAVIDLLPGFSAMVFGRGAEGLAWLTSMMGLGACVAGLWMAQRTSVEGLTRAVVYNLGAVACTLLLFVATNYFPFALAAITACGFVMIVNGVGAMTLIQSSVEGKMRGRVLSVYNLIQQGSPALGALAIGAISEHIGLRIPVGIGAALCLVALAWMVPRVPSLAAVLEGGGRAAKPA
jgi:MFS family permease